MESKITYNNDFMIILLVDALQFTMLLALFYFLYKVYTLLIKYPYKHL